MDTATFHRLVHIPPLNLARLIPEILSILVAETGVERTSAIYTELCSVQTSKQLAKINWISIESNLQNHSQQQPKAITELMKHIRLITDRAIIHPSLYKSKSIMTCKFRGQYQLSGPIPKEAKRLQRECVQHEKRTDEALAKGRAILTQFERIAYDSQTTYSQLRHLLDKAANFYSRYQEHKKIYNERFGLLSWYIEQEQSSQSPHLDKVTVA